MTRFAHVHEEHGENSKESSFGYLEGCPYMVGVWMVRFRMMSRSTSMRIGIVINYSFN